VPSSRLASFVFLLGASSVDELGKKEIGIADWTCALGLLFSTIADWITQRTAVGILTPLTLFLPALTSLTSLNPVSGILPHITHTHHNSETDAILRSRALWF
jgi:hypothetical protein